MDLGVGSFVFSQGIVSAIPLVKDAAYLHSPLLSKLLKVTKRSLPVIALGVVRVLLVKGTEYPVRNIGLRGAMHFDSLLRSIGTCNGIWSALELLHNPCIVAHFTGNFASHLCNGSHWSCWVLGRTV